MLRATPQFWAALFLLICGMTSPLLAQPRTLLDAVREGKVEEVALFLDAGADPAPRNAKGQTPLLLALNAGHTQTAQVIQAQLK